MRFGRVPKSEKARIMKQMQMVNSQGPTSEFDNLMQNTDEIVRSVLEAHQKTNEYSRERLHNLRKAAIENNNFECNVLEQTVSINAIKFYSLFHCFILFYFLVQSLSHNSCYI